MDKIVIYKDKVAFGNNILVPPFKRNEVDDLFGKHRVHILENKELGRHCEISVWDHWGIAGYLSADLTEYTSFTIRLSEEETMNDIIQGVYTGDIYIEKKQYRAYKWKEDLYFSQILKKGCFELSTFLIDELDNVPDKFRDAAIKTSRSFEITYIAPKKKTTKYKLTKLSEPVLQVSDFNFKLAVIQILMYEKNLLEPRFDIYEFVKEYDKRKIDIEEEGYEPIKEAVNWFKRLQIPMSLVDEIEEINMDGGSDIYHQIIPFWDGEDAFF